jgi:hypothetical protein
MRTAKTLVAATLCIGLATTAAHAGPFFTFTGPGNMGAADGWGGSNNSNSSVIFEVFFDFTTAADNEAGALLLWEVGDTSGSSLTLKGDDLLFASRHGTTLETVSAAHGLTAPQASVQVVTVIDLGNDLATVYVDGNSIGSGAKTQNDWGGGNPSALGTNVNSNEVGARPHTYVAGYGPIGDYPDAGNANFSFNAYLLADNDLNNILVPEPSTLCLATLGLLGLIGFGRRRKR